MTSLIRLIAAIIALCVELLWLWVTLNYSTVEELAAFPTACLTLTMIGLFFAVITLDFKDIREEIKTIKLWKIKPRYYIKEIDDQQYIYMKDTRFAPPKLVTKKNDYESAYKYVQQQKSDLLLSNKELYRID